MSIHFDDPLTQEQQETIAEILNREMNEIAAQDEKQFLMNKLQIERSKMSDIARTAGQPTLVELNSEGDTKTLSDGTVYSLSESGWVKQTT